MTTTQIISKPTIDHLMQVADDEFDNFVDTVAYDCRGYARDKLSEIVESLCETEFDAIQADVYQQIEDTIRGEISLALDLDDDDVERVIENYEEQRINEISDAIDTNWDVEDMTDSWRRNLMVAKQTIIGDAITALIDYYEYHETDVSDIESAAQEFVIDQICKTMAYPQSNVTFTLDDYEAEIDDYIYRNDVESHIINMMYDQAHDSHNELVWAIAEELFEDEN